MMKKPKKGLLWLSNLITCIVLIFSGPVLASSADEYEGDDNSFKTTTNKIETDGTKQKHTIHSISDEDWMKFDAQANGRYKIVVDDEDVGKDIDIALELHQREPVDSTETTRKERKNRGFEGEGETIDFTPSSSGTYYVKVTHTGFFVDETGYTISIKETLPENQAPVAKFSIDPESGEGTAPLIVKVDASASTDDGGITEYKWTSSDGQKGSNSAKTQFKFEKAGPYTITLIVTDAQGVPNKNTAEKTVTVKAPPVASFDPPTSGQAPLTVTLNSTSSDPDGDSNTLQCEWEVDVPGKTKVTDCQNATMTFDTAGEYNITLTVTDNDGLKNDNDATETVTVEKPSLADLASFTVSPKSGIAPLKVTITVTDKSGGRITNYKWKLEKDGNELEGELEGTEQSFKHNLPSSGKYTIILLVSDKDESDIEVKDRKTVSVTINQPPSGVEINITPKSGHAPLTVTLNATASDQDGDATKMTYEWTFEKDGINLGSATEATLSPFTLTEVGKYSISLTVTDEQKGETKIHNTVTVYPAATKLMVTKGGNQVISPNTTSADIVFQVTDDFGNAVEEAHPLNFSLKRDETEIFPQDGLSNLTLHVVNSNDTGQFTTHLKPMPEQGSYTITAKLNNRTDAIPELTNVFVFEPLPELPDLGKWEDITSNITFNGGISLDGGQTFLNDLQITTSDSVFILGSITVDDGNHEDAELLVAAAVYQADSDSLQEPYRFFDSHGTFSDKLVPFRRGVSLEATQLLEIWNGQIPEGEWGILFGYRLTGGTIVHSTQPIIVTVSSSVDAASPTTGESGDAASTTTGESGDAASTTTGESGDVASTTTGESDDAASTTPKGSG